MQNNLPQKAQRYVKEHLREKRWKRTVAALACIVAVCTISALVLPARTMSGETFCGKEAHQHSEECYEKVLICGQNESKAEKNTSIHTHTDACYETRPVLVCGQDESAGHKHDETCYDADGNLICGLEEAQGHTHTEACYQNETVLICDQDESAATDEADSHVHTDSCYEEKIVCQQEEHEHTLACYSNPDADVETAAIWEHSVFGVKLTGVWSDDLVAVAKTQLGYKESTENYTVTDDEKIKGITRFGQWYGKPYDDWDAMFVSFCLKYAGIPQKSVPYGDNCTVWSAALSSAGLYRDSNAYSPLKGDIVFLDYNGDGSIDHTGIVAEVSSDGTSFKSVEGDVDNRVQQVSHTVGESRMIGYAVLPENPDNAQTDSENPDDTQVDSENPDSAQADSEMTDNTQADSEMSSEEQPANLDASGVEEPQLAVQDSSTDSIALGETKTITVGAGEIVKLRFVPEYSHEYVFYSSASGDTYGYLYDANGRQLTYNDDGGDRSNFKITYTLNGGETYYWGFKWYSSSNTGDIPVQLELGTNHIYEMNEQGQLVCACGDIAPESGKCGDNLYWSLDKDGVLSITGSGTMANYYGSTKAPWSPFSNLIKQVTIEEGATSIGDYAFQNCTALETISLPNTLTRIGTRAFYGCSALTKADLSKTQITTVDHNVFEKCASLTEIKLPSTVSSIGTSTFNGCTALEKIDLSGTSLKSINPSAFSGCSALNEVIFPNTLNELNWSAFSGCSALTEIDLSKTGITTINSSTFSGCSSLVAISLPNTLTKIGDSAFSGCRALAEVDLSGLNITSLGNSVYQNCTSLETVSLPNTLTSVGDSAFNGCTALTHIDLSETEVTSIGKAVFEGCSSLTEALFPSTLVSIGESAFHRCSALQKIDLSGTGITSIGRFFFQSCTTLENVLLPDTVTSIGNYAFDGCTRLTQITIPEVTGSVGQYAFRDCDSLTELRLEAENINIDSTQTAIEDGFHVTVTGTVDQLSADTLALLTKMGCNAMSFVGPGYLTADNWQASFLPEQLNGISQGEYFFDEQGVFYRIDSETNTASVFYCPPGISNYTVPKELPAIDGKEAPVPVTGVDSNAFKDAENLTALTFEAPEVITKLADLAFFHAVNLETINGQSEATAVLSTFTSENLKTGTMLFWQTKITDSSEQPTSDALVVEKENLKLTVSTEKGKYRDPSMSENDTYLYYTGEAAKTTITISNPDSSEVDDGTVVRVYFQFDKKNGKLNYTPGTYTVVSTGGNKYTMRVVQTDTPGCYYAELERPAQGDTISIIMESSYPSPGSEGGNATIWCDILTEGEKDTVGNGLIPVGTHQSMNWTTVADTFPITKTESSTGSAKLVGDGEGGAYISGLSFKVDMSREGTTLEGVGKDYMRSVDFEDVLTLPEGVTLAEDVLKSIREGTVKVIRTAGYGSYNFETADGRCFLSITPSNANTNSKYLQNGAVSLDENGNLVIHWGFRNADLNTEIGNVYFTYKVFGNTLIVAEPKADVTYTVKNEVEAKQHFMYSDDQIRQAECSANVKTASGSLTIDKKHTSYNSSYGETRTYCITAENPGALPYERLAFLLDDLPQGLYMRPADLAAMFTEDTDHQLTITIVNATICEPNNSATVSGIDGAAAVTNSQNTGHNTEYNGMSGTDPDTTGYEASTITIAWSTDNQLQISVQNGNSFFCAADENAIRAVLESLALVVTPKTQYCLKWDLRNADGTVPPLPGGGQIVKNVFSTIKDTFMQLDNDVRNEHPTNTFKILNYVCGKDLDEQYLASDYVNGSVYREFYLGKEWSKDGETVNSETTIRQGDILDYTLNVRHSGKAQYDALPLVDHMSGTQALLAPVVKNSGADWAAGLEKITDNGVEYYVLTNPGTYHNVWTSEDQLADTVEVAQSESGLDTLIKWYFVNYTGSRKDTITYRSYVCPEETASGSLTYSLGNECWLNDHQSHRLYATLPGWQGTAFDFDKVIVDAVGDTSTGYRYCPVSEGQTVVYRLMLSSPTDKDGKELPMTITGKDMYDELPLSNSTYRWSNDNVRITYMDNYTVTNGDNWSVDEPAAGDQQYIKWKDDFSITFTGTVYIYVELDFPSEIPWQEYATKYATTTLVNSFHVLSAQRSVTHDVVIAAQVRLQKGVFDTGYYYDGGSYYKADMNIQDDRLYYQNNDVKIRAVRYYVSLYNEGPTNLYLTDMQDLLPRGFTYAESFSFNTLTNSWYGYEKILKDDGTAAAKMEARVTATSSTDENGRQRVAFHFAQSTSTSSSCISYDEDRKMCYLKPGEAIDFTYICKTNEAADTDDAALNIVAMPYYDFNNGGVVVDDQCSIISGSSDKYTPNDGSCDVLDNGQVENLGFTGGTNDTQWLESEVTLIRGSIKPGITKALTSKTDQNGVTTQNPISAAPSDILNWTIKTENDGTSSISDYVLTDRMQAPYMFTGKVSYMVYNTPASNSLIAKPYSNTDYLFTIENGEQDGTLTVKSNQDAAYILTVGGDPITISCKWSYNMYSATSNGKYKNVEVQLSIVQDSEGNAVMSMRFPDETMAIPENGYSELTLSTYNTTHTLENKQFVNTCFITPLAQVWDNTTNKGNVVKLDTPFGNGELSTVRNSAPVTTSYGYVTSSSKQVAEVEDPTNTAACTDEPNYIVLANETKQFRYTITVDNSTPKAMDMLVLIDGLPEVGDHTAFVTSDSRFSEFRVGFSDNPGIAVTVTDEEGNTTILDAGSYTIEYSQKTEFTSADWKGTSQWNADMENARAIRLKIFDSTGSLIPAGSTISLSFTCEIDDPNAQPGQTAWNSFGYHYSLMDEAAELEAAPLKVGVRIPSIPELRKQVVDHSGRARTVGQDETFHFLVYPGAALSGEYTTKEDLIAALGDTPYEEFSVVVKSGESLSESIRLQTEKWKWTAGQQYTVVELPCGEDYAFKRFQGSTTSAYTLTYTPGQTQIITCENIGLRWGIDLTKENTAHETLSGAVFALYSPDASDQLSDLPGEYADLDVSLNVAYNDQTWYLVSIQTTSEDGKLNWDRLLEEEYYLLEVKAPNGYNLNSPAGQILKQKNETQGIYSVTVINHAGYALPETGGIGTNLDVLGGLLLILSAGTSWLYYRTKQKKKGKISE